jgi:hypothetical protein
MPGGQNDVKVRMSGKLQKATGELLVENSPTIRGTAYPVFRFLARRTTLASVAGKERDRVSN